MEQLVARRAHNPKVVSSSLAPATQVVQAKSKKRKAKSRSKKKHPAGSFHLSPT